MEDIKMYRTLKLKFETLPDQERFMFLSRFYPDYRQSSSSRQDGNLLFRLLYIGRNRDAIVENLKGRFRDYGN